MAPSGSLQSPGLALSSTLFSVPYYYHHYHINNNPSVFYDIDDGSVNPMTNETAEELLGELGHILDNMLTQLKEEMVSRLGDHLEVQGKFLDEWSKMFIVWPKEPKELEEGEL